MAVPSDAEILELISRLSNLPEDQMELTINAIDDIPLLMRIDAKCTELIGPPINLN